MEEVKQEPIFNCHTHIFTIDHVPNKFAKRVIFWPFSAVFTIKFIKWLYNHFTEKGNEKSKYKLFKWYQRKKRSLRFKLQRCAKATVIVWLLYRFMVFILKWIRSIILNFFQIDILGPNARELRRRYLTLARYSVRYKDQRSLFRFLMRNYPEDTKFITLCTDMGYMGAGKSKTPYTDQLKEIIEIKKNPYYKNMIPFIAVDPRRIRATKDEEGDGNFLNYAKQQLTEGPFKGIKLYPAMGYYPFDPDLIDIWKFAQEKNIPVMTHCARGPVYYRGRKKKEWKEHPILEYPERKDKPEPVPLPQSKNFDFTSNFTHPLNFYCLMDQELLQKHIPNAPDLSRLKVCFAHFGGDDEWRKYRRDVWNVYNNKISLVNKEKYSKGTNTLRHSNKKTIWWSASWLSVIYDLMVKYENVYADVSSMLYHKDLYPLIKYLLHDEKVNGKILFGTDYYVVAKDQTDKTLYQDLRSYLGEELFEMIAVTNPKNYL